MVNIWIYQKFQKNDSKRRKTKNYILSESKVGAKWLKKVIKDEKFHQDQVNWKFNLSQLEDQSKRIIGLTKLSLYRSTWKVQLTFCEYEEVLLDVEINLRNRQLTYIEDDVQFQILTPNSMIQRRHARPLDDSSERDIWKKRYKYLKRCKDNARERWKHEYLVALRERHNQKHKNSSRWCSGDQRGRKEQRKLENSCGPWRWCCKTAGAQPEIFQSRWGFVKLGHFDKHFIKKSRKKAPRGKILEFFLLDTLKSTFWMASST